MCAGHRGRTSLRSSAGLTGSLLGLKLSSQTCPSPHSPSGRALSRSPLPSECSRLSSMIHQADSESLLGGPLLFMDKQGSVPGAMETGGWSGEPTHPNTSDKHADAGPRHFAQTPSMKRRTHSGDSGIPPPSLPLQHMMDGGYQRQSSRNSWLTTQEVRPSLFSGMFASPTQEDSHSGPLSPIDDSERLLSLQVRQHGHKHAHTQKRNTRSHARAGMSYQRHGTYRCFVCVHVYMLLALFACHADGIQVVRPRSHSGES